MGLNKSFLKKPTKNNLDWVKAVEGSVIPALSERVNPKVGMVIPWSFARPSDPLVAEGASADAEVSTCTRVLVGVLWTSADRQSKSKLSAQITI